MKGILCVLALLLATFFAKSQTYYKISHNNSVQTVGTNPVNVIGSAIPIIGLVCDAGPYQIGTTGSQNDSFHYGFTFPVTALRFRFSNVGEGDTVACYINGNFFPITSGHISQSQSLQFCTSTSNVCAAYAGLLGPLPGNNSKAHVEIHPGYPIDNVTIKFKGNNQGNGLVYSIWYATDPHVYVKEPFMDSIICAGDSVEIPYSLSDVFNTSNTFSVQLSDANGSFTNGTIIGTEDDFEPGNVKCGIPANMPDGTNYHYRIIASLPADTSDPNTLPLRIARYPNVTVANSSPVCDGEIIQFTATSDVAGPISWTGPLGFTANTLSPSIVATPQSVGAYKVSVNNYGCIATVSTTVQVKPIPAIAQIKNNSPMCENETLQLNAKAGDTSATYLWQGPAGYGSTAAAPQIANVPFEANGVYTVRATLNGCTSPPDSTTVVVYRRPAKPVITVNNPIKPGDSLVFSITGTPGATYQWNGPEGFNSTEQNPTKGLVDIYDEGDYTVVATLGSCTASSSVKIDVLQAALHYQMLPNPTAGELSIKGNYLVDTTIPVEIMNMAGQTVYSAKIATAAKFLDVKIDLKGKLGNGIYLMRLKLKEHILTMRFVLSQ